MASNSKNIAELLNGDVTVTAVDIADDAVTSAKIADDAVTSAKIADDAVTSAKIASTTLNPITLDTSNNRVGINSSSPASSLSVEGTLSVRTSSQQVFNDSVNANNLTMTDAKSHFNFDGADKDFQVSSDNDANALFVRGSDGKVGIGTGAPSSKLYVGCNANVEEPMRINDTNASGVNYKHRISFRYQDTEVGVIYSNDTGTQYGTTSDIRLKENINPILDAKTKLMEMNPVTHTWISNPESTPISGFIAQEMREILPEVVGGDESKGMLGVDYGRITPVIVAALQDAIKEIDELKNRIIEMEKI